MSVVIMNASLAEKLRSCVDTNASLATYRQFLFVSRELRSTQPLNLSVLEDICMNRQKGVRMRRTANLTGTKIFNEDKEPKKNDDNSKGKDHNERSKNSDGGAKIATTEQEQRRGQKGTKVMSPTIPQ